MDKTKIIVVEDNIVYCEYVCNMLSREGYHTMKAYHLSTAKKHLQQATDNDIVVADLRLPDGNGIDLLRWMRKEGKMQPFIIMTDYAEVHTAVESMKLGSIDYIPKQLVEDKLVPLLRSIQKERQAGQRRMPVFAREGSAFQKIMHRIRLVAATDMSVMIFGENGTGKEHIAHHLHDKSKRAGKPFVAVDCGSLTKELAPSAFFGHVKGAFTGADSTKKGYFYEAEGGTLFLDEVGNLALETQQMLLRAIQERRYRPIGDKSDRSFNVRIIAATNEDLEAAVSEKRFRQDLFYRLHDFGITVPPLRDCQEDILPLAEFFREIANKELECNVSGFSSEARKALLTHAWPGNVRELRQKIMGAVLQAQEGVATKEHLELAVIKPTSHVSFALRNDVWKIQCKLPPKTKRFCPLKTFNNAPLKSLDRWGYYYFSLFPSVCSHFTDTFSCQLNPVRRMYNTIHNGICYCRVSDCIIPIVRWQLRGDDDGLAPMSVLYYIEQDGSFLGIKVHKEEVIQYEQRAPFDSLEFRFQCAFYFCHLKRTHKFRSIRIICPYALLAGFIPHCCGKEALPGTG